MKWSGKKHDHRGRLKRNGEGVVFVSHGPGASIGVRDHLAGQLATQPDGSAQRPLDQVGAQMVLQSLAQPPTRRKQPSRTAHR